MKKAFSMAFPVFLVMAFAMTANAQERGLDPGNGGYLSVPGPGVEAPQPGVDRPPNAFGGSWQWTVFHASRFIPWGNSGVPGYFGNGYVYPSTSGDALWAQIDLPVGAEIQTIIWHVYDYTATGYFSALRLTAYQAARSGTLPDFEVIQELSTDYAGTPGYQLIQDVSPFPVMIRAYEDIDGSGGEDFVSYSLTVQTAGSPNTELAIFGATIVWIRVISPAPAVATFPDVGTGFWAFQYIEALVASGIIDGFPDGTFKPTEPITRAQVAKVLAVALGVHWPY